VDLVLFNQPQGILALVGAELSPRGAGGYKFQYSIALLDTVLYDTGGTLTLDNTDKVRWGLEQAFFVMLLYFMLVEVYELFEMGVSAGDPLAYFKSAGNAVDLFAYGLQFIAVEMWFRYVRLCENLDPELHWSVYTDYFATARYVAAPLLLLLLLLPLLLRLLLLLLRVPAHSCPLPHYYSCYYYYCYYYLLPLLLTN